MTADDGYPASMRCALLLALVAACMSSSCASAPTATDMDAILAEADRLMAAGDSAGCRDLLLVVV